MYLKEALENMKKNNFLMVMPSGWIGRPWDNIYNIEEIIEEEKIYKICLDEGWKLSICKDAQFFYLQGSLFILSKYSYLYFSGNKNAYNKGVILFINSELSKQKYIFDIYQKINSII